MQSANDYPYGAGGPDDAWAKVRKSFRIYFGYKKSSVKASKIQAYCGKRRTNGAAALNGKYTAAERAHVGRVKELPCSVCDTPGPSAAHHIKQHQHYTVVALCTDCHQGAFNGWHGQRRAWKLRKMDELDALAVTIERLTLRSTH